MNTYINLELKKTGNLVQVWQIWLHSTGGLVLGGCWGRHPFLLAAYHPILDLQVILVLSILGIPPNFTHQIKPLLEEELFTSTKLDKGKLTERVSEATDAQQIIYANPPTCHWMDIAVPAGDLT